jgi:hypothetical protein
VLNKTKKLIDGLDSSSENEVAIPYKVKDCVLVSVTEMPCCILYDTFQICGEGMIKYFD